ncbi:MAG TPA: LysR family transcriptional regulator [Ramlibacter sp.]|nr:LysR family transcriptional regulator [Ramlibacter sp.]
MEHFDLNLLRLFDALLRHGHLGHAAEELELSQPAASASLKRLREQIGDVLFVKAHNGMHPSPRAVALAPIVQSILSNVRERVLAITEFDPAAAHRTFTLALSDVGEMIFLPRLLHRLTAEAPHVDVKSVAMSPRELTDALQRGQVDLAVGYFPDLLGTDIFQQRLSDSYFVCLVRMGHPTIAGSLTASQFTDLPHLVLQSEGRSQEIVEHYLKKHGITRRGLLQCPHFLGMPGIIEATDLIATVPEQVGRTFATYARLQVLQPPFPFPPSELRQNWHRCQQDDPGNRWLRSMVQQLFSD